uniref:Pyr_redox_2 domain-containing protein n=1 Tax=Panagrellus redivivus TaxID=6233 RepID=A0A7E4VJN1_PANRE
MKDDLQLSSEILELLLRSPWRFVCNANRTDQQNFFIFLRFTVLLAYSVYVAWLSDPEVVMLSRLSRCSKTASLTVRQIKAVNLIATQPLSTANGDHQQSSSSSSNIFPATIVFGSVAALLYVLNREDGRFKKSALREFIDAETASLKKKLANKNLPEHVPYVLIGGGTAAYYAALTIRAYKPDSEVLIIASEGETPYNKPPLSKELWLYGNDKTFRTLEYIGVTGKKRDIRYESDGFYLNPGALKEFKHGAVAIIRNTTATDIDPVKKQVTLDTGKKVSYDKLLIATGGKPKIPYPFYIPHMRNKVLTYHNVSDFQRLHYIAHNSKSILIFGNGPVASELAFSLESKFGREKLQIVHAFSEDYPMQHSLPPSVGEQVETALKGAGVVVASKHKPLFIDKLPSGQVEVIFENDGKKKRVIVDHIVVADGITPSVKLAESAGLEIDDTIGGIAADSKLKTSNPDIFVAGDVAAYVDPIQGRVRVEQWENAQITGRLAGQNMTGNFKDFHHPSSFNSLFGHYIHLNGVGRLDSSLETVAVFAPVDKDDPDSAKGVVFYVQDRKVLGVLLVNVFGLGIELSRKIIADQKEIADFVQLAKLFDIYQPPTPEESEAATDTDRQENPEKSRPQEVVPTAESPADSQAKATTTA